MVPRTARLGGGIAILTAFLAGPLAAAEGDGFAELVELAEPRDGIAPAQLAEIEAAIAAYEKRQGAASAGKGEAPFLYPFFPQAGILGKDLFLNNFTDQDASSGLVRDWDCSGYTYDGHRGHDSLIRSFREQAIGVPVFAVLDGVVVDAHDGEPDMQTAWNQGNRANYVVIDHGGGYFGYYLHFRRDSVAVSPGQAVTAGTQIGLTGSSGFSDWPHLHFETRKDGIWLEPSAGPCRTGDSLWTSQPPVARDFYVADFYLSRGANVIPDHATYLLDPAERTATFVKGRQTLSQRVDLRNLPGGSTYRFLVLTPKGKVALERSGFFGFGGGLSRLAFGRFGGDLDLDAPGTWRFQLEINGELVVNAPFRVVATARQIKNRPPNRIAARLTPSPLAAGEVVTCEVETSLVTEDPDYDVVSYRYEWKIGGKTVRTVTSAALTDLLPGGTTQARDKVSCRVVPSDGKAQGPAAVAVRTVEEP
jgi:peptidase M23-like protein